MADDREKELRRLRDEGRIITPIAGHLIDWGLRVDREAADRAAQRAKGWSKTASTAPREIKPLPTRDRSKDYDRDR